MMRKTNVAYFFPLGLIICVFLDGTLSSLYASHLFTTDITIESRLALFWLVMAVFYGKVDHLLWWAFLTGLVFDIYYTGILGIFIIIFPLIVYLNREVYRFFTSIFLVVLLIYLIDITIVSALAYWANNLIGLTNVNVADFSLHVLWPTIVFNLALFVLLFIPVKNWFERFSH